MLIVSAVSGLLFILTRVKTLWIKKASKINKITMET